MTVYTLVAPMGQVTVVPGMILKLEAISPTTGAAITGVSTSAWSIFGSTDETDTGTPDTPIGPYMLVPGPSV